MKFIPLDKNQYHQQVHRKKYIFLHHTAGGSAASAIASWNQTKVRIATPFVIERNGKIYQCFNPKFWCNHLGGNTPLFVEKQSIGIELVSYGSLTPVFDGVWRTWTGRPIDESDVFRYDYRGYKGHQKYTAEQISSLSGLIKGLMHEFDIKKQPNIKDFFELKNSQNLPPGIYSHSTVRQDKTDIFPQPDLLQMIYAL